MRILIEPSDFFLQNSGDVAMLEVGVARLSALFPHASINVLTNVPDGFPRWASNVQPISARGYHAYAQQVTSLRTKGRRHLVRRWFQRFLRPHADPRSGEIEGFIDDVRHSDLMLATGMGGITDFFPKFAYGMLAHSNSRFVTVRSLP